MSLRPSHARRFDARGDSRARWPSVALGGSRAPGAAGGLPQPTTMATRPTKSALLGFGHRQVLQVVVTAYTAQNGVLLAGNGHDGVLAADLATAAARRYRS